MHAKKEIINFYASNNIMNSNINTNTTIIERIDKRGRIDPPSICPSKNDDNILKHYSEMKKEKKLKKKTEKTVPSSYSRFANNSCS